MWTGEGTQEWNVRFSGQPMSNPLKSAQRDARAGMFYLFNLSHQLARGGERWFGFDFSSSFGYKNQKTGFAG